jgi:anti-sigma-K factor RskA
MDLNKIIESGDLEAYVCGVLPQKEAVSITSMIHQHPELEEEVSRIEAAYIAIAEGVAPSIDHKDTYDRIKQYVKEHKSNQLSNSWSPYLGWAAALILFIGAGYLFSENTNLNEALVNTNNKNEVLQVEIEDTKQLNSDYQEALAFIKKPNTVKVLLQGQGSHEDASAIAFHNDKEEITYLDLSGLPEAPANMTYQLWSLTLNPLTPTSLGTVVVDNQLVQIDNRFETQAFGITLEEAGGSPTPTLERLYTLGVID